MPIKYPTGGTGGGGGGATIDGHAIQEEGATALTQRAKLNFIGESVTATDDSGNNASKVTVSPHEDLKRRLWLPSAVTGANSPIMDETSVRHDFTLAATAQASGTMNLHGGMVVRAGQTVSKISYYVVVAGSGFSNQWAALVDTAGTVLGKSADDTTTAWGTAAWKTFTLATPYVAVADIAVYTGLLIVASGMPTHPRKAGVANWNAAPRPACVSTGSLTTPASLGGSATIGAVTDLTYSVIS